MNSTLVSVLGPTVALTGKKGSMYSSVRAMKEVSQARARHACDREAPERRSHTRLTAQQGDSVQISCPLVTPSEQTARWEPVFLSACVGGSRTARSGATFRRTTRPLNQVPEHLPQTLTSYCRFAGALFWHFPGTFSRACAPPPFVRTCVRAADTLTSLSRFAGAHIWRLFAPPPPFVHTCVRAAKRRRVTVVLPELVFANCSHRLPPLFTPPSPFVHTASLPCVCRANPLNSLHPGAPEDPQRLRLGRKVLRARPDSRRVDRGAVVDGVAS